MHRFVAKANVDHFIVLLNDTDLTPDRQTNITKLLIAELDKLANDVGYLEFAEKKVAEGRDRMNRVKGMRNGHCFGTPGREQAEILLARGEKLQALLEDFCHRLRKKGRA